jgi:hypothetical protein
MIPTVICCTALQNSQNSNLREGGVAKHAARLFLVHYEPLKEFWSFSADLFVVPGCLSTFGFAIK